MTVWQAILRQRGGAAITSGSYVHIDNAGTTPTTPTMPLTSGTLAPAGLPGDVAWTLLVDYERPDRDDHTTFTATSPASGEWDVQATIGDTFCGGRATLYTNYGETTATLVFHIRGRNPSDAVARAYIDAASTTHTYAYAIAKHESRLASAPTTPTIETYYNQFNPAGSGLPPDKQWLPGPDWGDFIDAPNRGGTTPRGWGLFQLTQWDYASTGTYAYPERKHLWNWHTNTETAMNILDQKRGHSRRFERFTYNHCSATAGTAYTSPPTHLGHPSLDVATIQGFNGFGGPSEQVMTNGGSVISMTSCWDLTTNTSGTLVWTFVQNSEQYVQKVDNEF